MVWREFVGSSVRQRISIADGRGICPHIHTIHKERKKKQKRKKLLRLRPS